MSVVDSETEQYVEQFADSQPNGYLNELLEQNGYDFSAGMFADWPELRGHVLFDLRVGLLASGYADPTALKLLIMGHTVEAMQQTNPDTPPPNQAMLRRSIGELMVYSQAQPTLSFVTPTVVNLLGDSDALEYAGRMLAPPARPHDGWFPSISEEPIITQWQERFDDPHLTARLQVCQAYLTKLQSQHGQ